MTVTVIWTEEMTPEPVAVTVTTCAPVGGSLEVYVLLQPEAPRERRPRSVVSRSPLPQVRRRAARPSSPAGNRSASQVVLCDGPGASSELTTGATVRMASTEVATLPLRATLEGAMLQVT